MKKAIIFITTLFGAFYLFSGIIKIIDIDIFLYLIRSYNIKWFIYLAPTIPVLEIIIGLMLILRLWVKNVMFFSIVLLSFFTIIFTYGHFAFNIDDCGCFGGVDFLKMSPVIFYLRNGILISLSIYIYYSLQKEKFYLSVFKFGLIILAVTISSIIVGIKANLKDYLADSKYTITTIDDYHLNEFVNKNINETILSKYISTSKDSTYLVFVFSYSCPHCLISSFRLNEYTENGVVDKIFGLTKGSRKEHRLYEKSIHPKFDYYNLKQIEIREITNIFPVSFYVEKDTIRYRIKGALPEYSDFIKLYANNKN